MEKIKQTALLIIFWPIWMLLRFFRLINYPVRQDFHIGYLQKHITIPHLRKHLTKKGFVLQIVAYVDLDEILSLRKSDNTHYQYHLRVYRDNEVRGHYEYKPESKPIKHVKGTGMEDRYHDFLEFLEELIIPGRRSDDAARKNDIPQGTGSVAGLPN